VIAVCAVFISQASMQMQGELARVLSEQEKMIWIGRERLVWVEDEWKDMLSNVRELKEWDRATPSATRLHVWEEGHVRLSSEIAPRAAKLFSEKTARYRELEAIEKRFEDQRLLYARSVVAYNESVHQVPPVVRRALRLAHAPQLKITPRVTSESQ
jgi:hypothetical protein